jgi:hypothetical protein
VESGVTFFSVHPNPMIACLSHRRVDWTDFGSVAKTMAEGTTDAACVMGSVGDCGLSLC